MTVRTKQGLGGFAAAFAMIFAFILSVGWTECDPPTATGGALIKVTTDSTVGIVISDIPEGAARDAAAAELLAKPTAFWRTRAEEQLNYGYYRLTFRPFFYGYYDTADTADSGSPWVATGGQLPLPPNDVWAPDVALGRPDAITILGSAIRTTTASGLDVVQIDYEFETHLISDAGSPALSDPSLANVGGQWDETLYLPLDPYGVAQRTTPLGSTAQDGGGSPCVDEYDYPPGSWDEENSLYFHDQDCTDTATYCHANGQPMQSCVEAMEENTGVQEVVMHFKRIKYKASTADMYRNFDVPSVVGADLVPRNDRPGLNVNRVDYQHFPVADCAIEEGCVSAPGWRRVLRFDSVTHNVGGGPLHVGDIPTIAAAGYNFMEYHECHEHYHFNYYGYFDYGDAPGAKLSFCLESTNRLSNNESTSLVNPYYRCDFQGISSGWGDMYQAGLPCQFVDITDIDTSAGSVTHELTAIANPEDLLCEGEVTVDEDGVITDWYETDIIDHHGPVFAPVCDQTVGADSNNVGHTTATVQPHGQSYVTEPCDEQQTSPVRNCGLEYLGAFTCDIGQPVTHNVTVGSQALPVVRICEMSDVLGTGVGCTWLKQIPPVDGVLPVYDMTPTFICPEMRDAPGQGGYSIYLGDALN